MFAFYRKVKKYLRMCLYTACVSFFVFNTHQVLWAKHPVRTFREEVFYVKFNKGLLSVKLKNSPMKKALEEILKQSRSRMWMNDTIDDVVTIEFQDVPVREGVRRILKGKNYAFIYSPLHFKEGKLTIVSSSRSDEASMPDERMGSRKKPMPAVAKHQKPTEKASFENLMKDALGHEDADKREEAIIALGESKDKRAIEVISKALSNDPSEDVRLSSIDALLEIGDKTVVEPLSSALKDKEPWVRESAVEALASIGGNEAIEFIKSALNDTDSSVRDLAQETLDEMKGGDN
jgi:HEAT repeat protein